MGNEFFIEVLPLQPPFPEGVHFIHLQDHPPLALSEADFRTLQGLMGRGDWEGRQVEMSSHDGKRVRIRRIYG
jgi:hypothetical protein